MRNVAVGSRAIGDGLPCFVIAEAGSNHGGSLEQAKRLIEIAGAAGADAVKFQAFRASRLYPRGAGQSDYLRVGKSIYDVIAEAELPYDWLPALFAHCAEHAVRFMASVFDEETADLLDEYVDVFKVASYELTHIPLIRHVAGKGKPVILSTGTADLDEVRTTVNAFRESGNEDLILLQCTAAYPAPLESLNLRTIPAMKAAFGVPVGLSDHSRDPVVAPVVAVAVGANVIEKHFTLSNDLPGPDHRFAVEPPELRTMIQKVREAEQTLGSGKKIALPVEQELRQFARRSIFAVRDISSGEALTRENIAVLRCGKLQAGMAPAGFDLLLGRVAARAIPAECAIRDSDYI